MFSNRKVPEAPDFDENWKSIFLTRRSKIIALCIVTEYQCDWFWVVRSHISFWSRVPNRTEINVHKLCVDEPHPLRLHTLFSFSGLIIISQILFLTNFIWFFGLWLSSSAWVWSRAAPASRLPWAWTWSISPSRPRLTRSTSARRCHALLCGRALSTMSPPPISLTLLMRIGPASSSGQSSAFFSVSLFVSVCWLLCLCVCLSLCVSVCVLFPSLCVCFHLIATERKWLERTKSTIKVYHREL